MHSTERAVQAARLRHGFSKENPASISRNRRPLAGRKHCRLGPLFFSTSSWRGKLVRAWFQVSQNGPSEVFPFR